MESEPANGKAVFAPETVAAINQAYEEALRVLQIANAHSDRRAALAKHIMDAARGGEVDPARLRDQSVAAQRRTDHITERAHQIWTAEGRPDGRHDEHWRLAEEEYDRSRASDRSGRGPVYLASAAGA
jgi:Protein of unknown function (DUF2934)